MTYSNPRLSAEFTGWPLGGSKRGVCRFFAEKNNRGVRIGRIMTGKTKYTTYSPMACIVDGDDGRTYILYDASHYGFVGVWTSAFMSAESIFKNSDPARYAELLDLIGETADVTPVVVSSQIDPYGYEPSGR